MYLIKLMPYFLPHDIFMTFIIILFKFYIFIIFNCTAAILGLILLFRFDLGLSMKLFYRIFLVNMFKRIL